MQKTRSPLVLCAVFLLLMGLVTPSFAAPVPPLVSERDAVWEAAWETAWEIAWETPSELTVEFSGDVQELEGLEFTVEFQKKDSAGQELDLSWGLPEDAVEGSADLVASFGLPWAQERSFTHELRLGKLYVQITPADASIQLLNAQKPFSQGMDLSAGQYVIEVAREGYEPQVRRVEVLEGMAATVRMDLMQVADAGASLPAASGYLPPEPDAATPEQLAKDLATPPATPAATAVMQTASQTAAQPAAASTPAASLGSLQLASAEDAVAPAASRQSQQAAAVSSEPVEASADTGSLRVRTTPADARVRIMDIKPVYHDGIALEPGEYTIDVQLYGYGAVTRTVTIEPGRETSLDIALQELPEGRLYVKTVPENAYVRILDIRPRFQQGMALAEGEYTIDATVSGYKTVEKTVLVTGGKDTVVEVQLEQVAPTGRLYVDTLPADAEIRVLGIMPKFHQGIELAEGLYTIDAKVDGAERVEMQVQVKADQDNRYTMALNDDGAQPGRLYVQTNPAGAAVRILDIKPRFEQGMLLEAGAYTIDVAESGYATRKQTVSVFPGRETRVTVDLAPSGMQEKQNAAIYEEPLVQVEAQPEGEPAFQSHNLEDTVPVKTGMAAGDSLNKVVAAVKKELPRQPKDTKEVTALNVEATEEGVRALDIEIFLSMAQLALNAGDYMGALDSAAQVLTLDPDNVQAFKVRSQAFKEMGQYSDALKTLDTALAKNPGNTALQAAKEEVQTSRRQRSKQEAQGSTAISLDPGYYKAKGQ